MSSSSDQEDFFDAEDETPSASFADEPTPKLSSISLSQLEEEERRLMQLKQIADERRRREDEELEQRLLELQQRKRASKTVDNRDTEQEERQRKLEEMRQALVTDGSLSHSLTASIDSSSQDTDSPNTSAAVDVSDAFALSALRPVSSIVAAPKSHTIEKMENNGGNIGGAGQNHSYRQHAKKRSGSWGDLPKNDTRLESGASATGAPTCSVRRADSTSSSDSGRKKNSLSRQTPRESIGSTTSRTSMGRDSPGNSLGRDVSLKNSSLGRDASLDCSDEVMASSGVKAAPLNTSMEEKLSDIDQNMDWYPEKEKQNKSLTLLISGASRKLVNSTTDQDSTDSVVDTILQQTQVNDNDVDEVNGGACCGDSDGNVADDPHEPDIVKSTKTRTPPPTLKPPVAPPRRKKSKQMAHVPGLALTDQSMESDQPEPGPSTLTSTMFLRGEPPSPNLGARGRDKLLDVKTVLEGSRHIVVTEDEADNKPQNEAQSKPQPRASISSQGSGKYSGSSQTPVRTATASSGSTPLSSSQSKSIDPSPPTTHKFPSTLSPTASADSADSLTRQIQNWQMLGDSEREASPNRRPRSSSGRLLSDEEILELVTVRNLDTGETIPLSTAEDKLPKCVNPLALHIMRRTKEYSSDTSLHIDELSDESDSRSEKSVASSSHNVRKKGAKIKKFIGKTVSRVKSAADSAMQSDPPMEEEVSVDGKIFKIKSSSRNKGPYDFSQPNLLQEMSGEHTGAIWVMKFSPCGKLLATGGQDTVLRIWVLKSTASYFEDFRQKYADVRLSPAVSHESLNSTSSADVCAAKDPLRELNKQSAEEELMAPFQQRPFCIYKGHTADLLDLSWSKNYFILSSSMDKTVRLWHISRRECLCTFQHIDFVTAIVFHPKDDRYFLSGALDGKLRLWNIPDKKVALWNELSGSSNLITTANFCHNGRLAVVGTYDGKCIFYTTEQLKYYTMVNVRSTRGKNSRGRKITGIETMPGEEKILVTSNDSRLRMYNLKDLTLSCKYKGCMNNSSQIRASFSPTGKYVVCGSEDHFLYVWKTNHEFLKFTSARRDRNDYWEAIKVHNAVVTAAVFAPNPSFIFRMAEQHNMETRGVSSNPLSLDDDTEEREIIVSADFTGAIKVITNRPNSRSMFF